MKATALLASVIALAALPAQAASIPIVNHSFEADAAAVGGAGGWSDAVPTGWADPNGATNGNFMEIIGAFASEGTVHLGFDQASDGGSAIIFQDLSTAWAPNTTYTLTVGVGNRPGWSAGTGTFGFGSSTDVVPSASVFSQTVDTLTLAPADGQFTDLNVVFSTGAVAPSGNIRIFTQRVNNGGPRLHVDNYRLDAIPEPSSLASLVLAAALLLRRRRA